MKKFLFSMIVLAASCLTAITVTAQTTSSYFPGGYQSRAQSTYNSGYTANSYFLAENITLTWDYNVGQNGAYTLADTQTVYDLDTKSYYLRFANNDGEIRYFGPLYSPDHPKRVTDYFPGSTQYRKGNWSTVNSYFLADSVQLNWNPNLARNGAYTLSGAKVAYDRNSKKFYLYDGVNWFGPLF